MHHAPCHAQADPCMCRAHQVVWARRALAFALLDDCKHDRARSQVLLLPAEQQAYIARQLMGAAVYWPSIQEMHGIVRPCGSCM
eukprot:365535-Chlamydomonas_euryale.AAC.31